MAAQSDRYSVLDHFKALLVRIEQTCERSIIGNAAIRSSWLDLRLVQCVTDESVYFAYIFDALFYFINSNKD